MTNTNLPTFYIDPNDVCSIPNVKVRYKVNMTNPSPEELVKILKNEHISSTSTYYKDHPNFILLRDKLENEGFIITEKRWHNGDEVLKPFALNGIIFDKGDKFPSSAYMNTLLKFKKKGRLAQW